MGPCPPPESSACRCPAAIAATTRPSCKKAEQAYERTRRDAEAAHAAADRLLARAHRLDCEAWTALQFIGGPENPSPSIVDAIHGGCELLEVRCRRCGHEERVDLALVVWPSDKPVASLGRALECRSCKKGGKPRQRPELVALLRRPELGPAAPAGALGRKARS